MSTANFCTMQNFPLYVKTDDDFYYETEDNERHFDELEAQDFCNEVEDELENINDNLIFHKITLKSGYYSGLQFYVEEVHDNLEDFIRYWDNYDCRYHFGFYKSEAVRKFKCEITKVNRILKKLAKAYGFEKYHVSAVFSNGEVWYTKANVKAKSKAKAKAEKIPA